MYTQPATSITPALVIYLIDASSSMNRPCGETTRIDVVNQALKATIKDLVRRSLRDTKLMPRYKIAIFAYSTEVIDVLDGIRDLPELVSMGLPVLSAGGKTDMEAGFAEVEKLLRGHLSEFQYCPAPLVCHLTDALLNTELPTPLARRIMEMRVDDGNVLVENVYVADTMLRKPVHDWQQWGGVLKEDQLTNEYAKLLFQISSPIPETYRKTMNDNGYRLQKGAALFFPGTHSELIHLAFAVSSATQIK